jgi:hypothetical protein
MWKCDTVQIFQFNSIQFFIIYVPSQQPQGQLQTEHRLDTSSYIIDKHYIKSKTNYRQALDENTIMQTSKQIFHIPSFHAPKFDDTNFRAESEVKSAVSYCRLLGAYAWRFSSQHAVWGIETSFPFNSLTYDPWLHSVCSTSCCVLSAGKLRCYPGNWITFNWGSLPGNVFFIASSLPGNVLLNECSLPGNVLLHECSFPGNVSFNKFSFPGNFFLIESYLPGNVSFNKASL